MQWDKTQDDNATAIALASEGFTEPEIKAVLAVVPDYFQQAGANGEAYRKLHMQPPGPAKRR